MNDKNPEVSVVIPVYNEEGILRSAVHDLMARMPDLGRTFEIILAENGSSDDTIEIAKELSGRYPEVSMFSADQPDYGLALRQGISRARGRYVMCDEIDICDVDFYSRSLEILSREQAVMVVGSKAMKGANDRRPLSRRAATQIMNGLLRALLGFKGTDTHGLKAFTKDAVEGFAEECIVNRDLFASEFVIRTQRGGAKVVEIPVTIVEKRPPSIDLVRRVPAVLKGLGRLVAAIRLGI